MGRAKVLVEPEQRCPVVKGPSQALQFLILASLYFAKVLVRLVSILLVQIPF
jgi:hypothetical protein